MPMLFYSVFIGFVNGGYILI